MEKFIKKTTKEFFYDEKGYLLKEVETVEEYKTDKNDSDTTVENISVKIHVDEDKVKESTIKSDEIKVHSITKERINPDVKDKGQINAGTIKKSEVERKEWNKANGVPNPFNMTSIFGGNEAVLILNDASLDEIIGSTIKRIQKRLEQEATKKIIEKNKDKNTWM